MSEGVQTCYVCGGDPKMEHMENQEWVVLGIIDDKLHADFGEETLKSCHIPVVVMSKSGFFGNIGLFLNPIYTDSSAAFEISVPEQYLEEATDILDMTLGTKFHRKGL
ncbi:MAG TPA: hypothetical protein VHP63_01790 [candidate division Zixibacteria bacterium]|nr:hypothetical protein [candidate division Zixibacteria bacterium]